MFISAEPRSISNGFEAFVPNHRAELLHQRLVEMTNNDFNAWSVYPPAASVAANTWDQHLDDFGHNENFSVQPLYGGYFQDNAPSSQSHAVDYKTVSYATVPQVQGQRNRRSIAHQDSTLNMNCFEQPSPMLGHDYSQYSLARGRGSFAEFQNARHIFKYQPSTESATNSFTSDNTSGMSTSSYSEDISNFGQSLDVNKTSSDTAYSSYSPRMTPAASQTPTSLGLYNTQQVDSRENWCLGSTIITKEQNQIAYDVDMNFDGLPRYPTEEQAPQYTNPWTATSNSADKWALQSIDSSTISPKALTLNASTASLASSGSSQEPILALSEASAPASIVDGLGDLSSPENLVVVEPQQSIRRTRQILPDSGPISRRIVPVLPSNDSPSSRNTRKRSVKVVEPDNHARRSSPPSHLAPTATSRVQKSKDEQHKPSAPKRIEPKPVDPVSISEAAREESAATLLAAHHRDAKDDFLVRSKLAGMSYKEIRRQGKFTEAESTLRGRFRTLTKHKAARVRKPEWNENDIRLLKRAVRKLSQGDPSRAKVPWKQVAEYIANNGGSYHFGNATCRKRWDEL